MMLRLIHALLAATLLALPAQASTLLRVDVTDPSAVTFTATGAMPTASETVADVIGFSLEDFWTATTSLLIPATTSTLVAGTGAVRVTRTFVTGAGGTYLNLYGLSGADYTFDTASAAFAGTATFDLSGFASLLPGDGATGLLRIGSGIGGTALGADFGSWEAASAAVPLPAGLPLILAALGALGIVRARRRG